MAPVFVSTEQPMSKKEEISFYPPEEDEEPAPKSGETTKCDNDLTVAG